MEVQGTELVTGCGGRFAAVSPVGERGTGPPAGLSGGLRVEVSRRGWVGA